MRALLWLTKITKTLLIFWVKNPTETPAILGFIFEKVLALQRFFIRNVMTEKQSSNFSIQLSQIVKLYNLHNKKFDPKDSNSYKNLEKVLNSKSQLLYFLVRKINPKIVLETGVATGESTGYILQALFDNKQGRLYSIDLPFQWYIYGNHKLHLDSLPVGKMSGYLVPEKIKKNWTLILGSTYQKMPEILKKLKHIEVFLHDSEHTDKTMCFEFEQAWPYIQKGGFLLSDDVSYTKAFFNFANQKKVKYIIFKDLGVILKR